MIIDGKKLASEIKEQLKQKVAGLARPPRMAIFSVEPNAVTERYLSLKQKFSKDIGVECEVYKFDAIGPSITNENLIERISEENENVKTDAIIVQLPLPHRFNVDSILSAIAPEKDIDALSSNSKFVSPVALVVLHVLDYGQVDVSGKRVAILGGGRLVGIPVARELSFRGGIVTILKKGAQNFSEILGSADIIVTGAGDAHFLKPEMIKE
ncbi:MAG: bifunctional 5,10-methylenetetrahydrofolate dehydrogenase/5,10-methenyltetrahydrofolate cyclohydrolase, partial [Patescibacteria group bacterium]